MNDTKVLITGGAGTLGRAIVRYSEEMRLPLSFAILSRDPLKHYEMQKRFPACRYVAADIIDPSLERFFFGHDVVIHAAAVKHIPQAEENPALAYETNVIGSVNVLRAAAVAGVKHVFAISTDKACRPLNAYGCTKLMMERIYQSFAQKRPEPKVHLVRYGNVIASNGSVVHDWRRQLEQFGYITPTSLEPHRFWMSPKQAVRAVFAAGDEPSGTVFIPRMKELQLKKFAELMLGAVEIRERGMRPGEKIHEELLSALEAPFAEYVPFDGNPRGAIRLWPLGMQVAGIKPTSNYSTGCAPAFSDDEFMALFAEASE